MNSSSERERKRRRMQSNRESARRSRMRKQKHLDDLTAEIAQLWRENKQILKSINGGTQQCMRMEAHNSVLRAQMMDLSQRLHSLNQLLTAHAPDSFFTTHHHPIMAFHYY
ncbi:bZIP transcription factor 2-like [Salvia miltiorrhiza]|uniref:bZIP transcription factor 2-like n=1 Tax=Salvia miltiorrhiza TaxID=226208 RepID=UPI0025AD9006|nr:bZIP transcription factor 2-like [Salvia miltiorrhiza]